MPPTRTTRAGYQHSCALRQRLTPAEVRLRAYLRNRRLHGVVFRRQHAIGPYVVDLCSPRHGLIIELDGSLHLHQEEQDLHREEYLASRGYRVLRFWNNVVLSNINGVITAILTSLKLE